MRSLQLGVRKAVALHLRVGRGHHAECRAAGGGGTLCLDEIGTLAAGAQRNLLRALQEGEIERLGDTQTRRVDVRVIAASNVDLREEAAAGRFREDLFFRLNVFPIRVPPWRERREDMPLLMTHFLAKFNRQHGRRLGGFTPRAADALMTCHWPGHIRELENVVERVSKCVNGLLLGAGHTARVALDEIETLLLRKAVERTGGSSRPSICGARAAACVSCDASSPCGKGCWC